MKKIDANAAYDRLRSCIIADKGGALSRGTIDVLRHDLERLLTQYFDIKSVSANLDYDKDGNLWLTIDSLVRCVKPLSVQVADEK